MMKKQKQLSINFSPNEVDEETLLSYIENIIGDAAPKNILGMLATASVTSDNSVKFYNKYILRPIGRNDYEIYNLVTREFEYKHVSLFLNAIYIIYSMHKNIIFESVFKSKLIYDIDQEYGRCLWNVNFYKNKIKKARDGQFSIYSDKLEDSKLRLLEIKSRLSHVIDKGHII